jgi:hypothetical protein
LNASGRKETSPARTRLAQLLRYAHQKRNGQYRLLLQLLDQSVEIRQAVLVENYGHIHERWQQIIWQIRRMLEDGKAKSAFDRAISTELMFCLFMDLLTLSGREPLTATLSAEELFAQAQHVFFEGIDSQERE